MSGPAEAEVHGSPDEPADGEVSRLTEARATVAVLVPAVVLAGLMITNAQFPLSSRRAPLVVAGACIALSVYMLIRCVPIVREAGLLPGPRGVPLRERLGHFWHDGTKLAVLTTLYVGALERVDFLLLTAVFCVVGAWALSGGFRRRPPLGRYAAFGVAVPLAVHVVFTYLLPIRLP